MSATPEATEKSQNLLPLPATWVESLTEHAQDVALIRLSYASAGNAELYVPEGVDDWHVRMVSVLDDTRTRELNVFDVSGIGNYSGPRALAEWLWEEGQDHWRWERTRAENCDDKPPNRLPIVMTLLDAKNNTLDTPGSYTGIRSRTKSERRATSRGVNFAENETNEEGEPDIPASPSRVNRELERGYINMVKLTNSTAEKFASSTAAMADKVLSLAERANVGTSDEEGESDEVLLAVLEIGKTWMGEGKKRQAVADDIRAAAPKDGGAGGPACAFARAAIKAFTLEDIQRCIGVFGQQTFGQIARPLRWALTDEATDKKLIADFKQSAEWFVAMTEGPKKQELACIPAAARGPLQSLISLTLA